MTAIGNAETNLLLNLLEAKVLRFTNATLAGVHGALGRALIDAGFMVPAGFESVDFDCVDRMREVTFDPATGEHGIQDPMRGWVPTERSALALYAPDLSRIFACLIGDGLRPLPTGPAALEGDVVWRIGSAYLGRSKPTEIWFSRRLHDPRCEKCLVDVSARRPAADRRLVLTSTVPRSAPSIVRTTVIPIADALSWETPAKIDIAILEARLDDRTGLATAQAVYLSDDNGTLYIHGEACVVFTGKVHKRIARRLVDAHNDGKLIKAAGLLALAGSNAASFDQAFGPKWKQLSRHLRSHQGYWRFET